MRYEIVELEPRTTLVVRSVEPIAELPAFFGRAYGAVFHALSMQGVDAVGEPITFYPGEPADPVELEAGVIVDDPVEAIGEVAVSTLPGGRVVVATHVGPYEQLEQTYRELLAAMAADGLRLRPVGMWEQYLTDPDTEPDATRWRTRIFLPVAD